MISTSEILEFIKYNEENQENESSHRSSEVQREPKRVGIKDPTERDKESDSLTDSNEATTKGNDVTEQIADYELQEYDYVFNNKEHNNHIEHTRNAGGELTYNKILGLSAAASKALLASSQNIGVQSLILDIPSSTPIPPLEAAAIACVLQDCLDILKILEYTIPAKIDERWDESYKSLDEKYGCDYTSNNIFREEMGLLPLIPTAAEKLQRDRTYVYKILEGTLNNIKKCRRYDYLETEVDNIIKTIDDEHALQIDYEIWSDLVYQLQDLAASEKKRKEDELKESMMMSHNADIEADNSIFLNNSKLEYVKKWEEDRLNQKYFKLSLEEREVVNKLNEIGKMERSEAIAVEDFQTYLKDYIAYLENKTKEWMNKYNSEITRRQIEMYNLKEEIEEQKEQLQELYNLHNDRQAFIDECLAEKEKIKREEEYWKRTHKAATVIQSLWRGYMVRKQLGEYKGLRARLRKRKKLAIAAKKREAWQKKKEISRVKPN